MYLEYINYQNVGAIHNLSIPFSFHENGNPKPIIFVGENGSGKSILLSNIVDAFYEFASEAYSNASVYKNNVPKYYKVISPVQISPGQNYMTAYLRFCECSRPLEYIFKCGKKDWEEYKTESFNNSILLSPALNWSKEVNNHKAVALETQNVNNESIERIFESNVICYFPPDRYEKPNWLEDSYYTIAESEHLKLTEKFSGMLYNSITVSNPINENLKWLLDVIVDSRAEVVETGILTDENNGRATYAYGFAPRFNQGNLSPLLIARTNVELILSDILGKQVCFELNMRNVKNLGRFRVVERETGNVVIPTFDSLSTGQMALFNLFVTIIRYADYNDVNKSIKLHEIFGIVVIDEIELHLHSKLQKEILPKLIKRFPKVQFIITSHSPLFILGMEKLFGSDDYELYQLPDGIKIGAEMFSEFQKAYDYLTDTQKYQAEIVTKISASKSKPLIVTEGKTDWIHLKAAYENLKLVEKHKPLFEGMDIDFLEYTTDMGDSQLCTICEGTSKIKRDNAIIFIADADKPNQTKALKAPEEKKYKTHGDIDSSRTYSFILPVPPHREETPLISIEHYYTDEVIKSMVVCKDNKERRLYFGNEFDKMGRGKEAFCGERNKCGTGKINIIDSDVFPNSQGNDDNIALSKYDFAQQICKHEKPFENVSFENFIPIFEIIREILIAENVIVENIEKSVVIS